MYSIKPKIKRLFPIKSPITKQNIDITQNQLEPQLSDCFLKSWQCTLPVGKSGLNSGMDWTGLDWTRLWTGLDQTLDWTGLDWTSFQGGNFFWGGGLGAVVLFFLVCKKIAFSTSPQQAIIFHLGRGGRGVVSLVCLFLLHWSLCLTHGRHVSLES